MEFNTYDMDRTKNPLIRLWRNSLHSRINKIIKKINPDHVLDIGARDGLATKKFMKGIDAALVMGDIDTKRASVMELDICLLHYLDSSFDLVIAKEVLEHLENPFAAIKECKRVAKKYCVFVVPNEPLFRWCNVLRGKYWKYGGNNQQEHLHNWNIREFKNLLYRYFDNPIVLDHVIELIGICKVNQHE